MSGDWFSDRSSTGEVDAADVITPAVFDHLFALLALGALVSFSKSRDGGAVAVTVTHDGEWRREWFRSSEELERWIANGVEAVTRRASDPPSGGSVRRLRGSQNGTRAR